MDTTESVLGRAMGVTAATSTVRTALFAVIAVLQLPIPAATPSTAPAATDVAPCCDAGTAVIPAPTVVATSSDGTRALVPDATADYIGGAATRLHTADGTPIPGDLFLLMATPGSVAPARLFDRTAYRHGSGPEADALESNRSAAGTVQAITGIDVDILDLTTAPGGGNSGGLIYAIAYFNVISDGAFTGELRIAATGRIARKGYVQPINAVNEKTAAAHFADADVFFTPSIPAETHLDRFGARQVGELNRAGLTGNSLDEERHLDRYHSWGANRADGMDIVGVRHVADVAAYLCGAGSTYACTVTSLLADTATAGGNTDAPRVGGPSAPAAVA
jgi:hypothetical protein